MEQFLVVIVVLSTPTHQTVQYEIKCIDILLLILLYTTFFPITPPQRNYTFPHLPLLPILHYIGTFTSSFSCQYLRQLQPLPIPVLLYPIRDIYPSSPSFRLQYSADLTNFGFRIPFCPTTSFPIFLPFQQIGSD